MNTKRISVLIVDDIETNREMLKRRLQRKDFDVTLAEGGRQALAMLADRDFDVVLLDIMMPDISGIETLREIRANKQWQNLPVIMVTATDEEDTLPECLDIGANDYVSKPVNIPVLTARIRSQVSRKWAMDEVEQTQAWLEERVEKRTLELQTSLEELKQGCIERDQAKFESILAKTRLMDAINSLGDGFALFDSDFRLQFTNSMFYELYDFTPLQVPVGTSYEDFLRKVAHKGLVAEAVGRENLWMTEQLKVVEKESEHFISSGRWLRIGQRKTSEGGLVGVYTDITTTKAASDKIENLAFYDPLTQLPNRRLGLDRINQFLAASARNGQYGALLFIDLDHFKSINDTLGHEAGDLLLKHVATRLTGCVRESDTISRFGGDEFVVLLGDLSPQAIDAADKTQHIAEKILLSLNQPYQLNTHTYLSTTSIGATVFSGHKEAAEELLKQADTAMYQSKAAGRNTLTFFDPAMQQAIIARVAMEKELGNAIKEKQFQLYYQIQVDSAGQALGAEALIRWLHPEQGIITPFDFIPLAEETGLIIPIGQWVLDAGCAQLKAWQSNPKTQDLILAINVSAKQFNQRDFVQQVKATVQRHDINPAQLKLELTESMLVVDINSIIIKMNVLNKIGIKFSLDDFGTGYSSLQHLKKLPITQLKIDKSFVSYLIENPSDRVIVRTIITMANSLEIQVIAEGVETVEQRDYLLNNGCMYYQGYLFSKPVQIEEFETLLLQ
ncbi:MAG: diguanylate cyclase (GGDEF)-like protein [Arenicella sp.]|jgi:diguanylate cyclase (GGDEF)-like protein